MRKARESAALSELKKFSVAQNILMVEEDRGPGPSEANPIGGDNARLFFSPAMTLNLPFSRWPSESELASKWQEIRRRSPEEGLREAEQVFEEFRSREMPLKEPVFGD